MPNLLGEVGEARADRGGWSQTAEFASLILDSGWAWAAVAVVAGWLVSSNLRPTMGLLVGALSGCVALVAATAVYYCGELLFTGDFGWGWVTRFWLVGSVALGPPLGAVGATIRRPGPVGAFAALVVPVGAAANMVVLPPPQESLVAGPVRLTVWFAAAATAVFIAVRAIRARRRRDRDFGAEPVVRSSPPADAEAARQQR
ncbi:hypothetical protein ABTX15_13220 [Micromonospora sp. NPDC094482]|uniref:hypothetical protein n=1 Tax=unclassified Micromonospora TaxID=2617518 RepID=UPI003318E71C